MRKLTVLLIGLALGGCASTVQKADVGAPAAVTAGPGAGKPVVLNITGSTVATTAKDWKDFKALWPDACSQEAAAAGTSFSMQDGAPAPTGSDGTLVVLDVADFRYVSTATRIMFGIMTGNAFINAQATFRDLRSGDLRKTKAYDTTSTAWQGIFSGMTTKQVRAMCHEIFAEAGR